MNGKLTVAKTIQCDVLIVGAGGAGLRCASEILERRPGCRVVAVTKVPHPQKSHTSTAQGGMAAVDPRDPADRPIFHMFDTWKGSDCSADQHVVEKIVGSAWDQILWLEGRGMHFTRNEDGRLSKRTFGGHTLNFGEALAFRAVFEADRTGKGIMDTSWGESLKGGVAFINQSLVTELLFKEGRCIGALIFRQKEGELIRAWAKAVVLATGGNGQVFRVTTNCRQNTGDGLALVLAAGLPLMDPEAIQFHPTGIVGPGILASEAIRGEGGILRNRDLEPFMERYAPKLKDLAPRDLVSRAIETEIREGRGILNPDHRIEHVWIDLRHLPDHVHDVKLPEITGFFKKFLNMDPKTELCPVRPSNHYQMGGIPTTEHGEVERAPGEVVPGLFAVGECAAASFHGFNRLATNSLLELITMGKFVGERVCEYIREQSPDGPSEGAGEATLSKFSGYLEAAGTENQGKVREEMKALMTEKAGVFRNEAGLSGLVEELKALKERALRAPLKNKSLRMNPELVLRWELDNLLDSAMAIAQGALNRRESRGGHFREDHPERKREYDHHTLLYMEEYGKVRLGMRPINMKLFEGKGEHFERFDMIERKY